MKATDNEPPVAAMIFGEVASFGLARGRALVCDWAKQTVVPRRQVSETEVLKEIERFDDVVSAAEGKLLEVQASVRRNLGNRGADIFETQIFLMRDAQLRDAIRDRYREKRMNVEAALDEAIKHLMVLFGRLEDPYFREQAADLAHAALGEARNLRWRIVPRCSYVAGFIKPNSEFADLVEPEVAP